MIYVKHAGCYRHRGRAQEMFLFIVMVFNNISLRRVYVEDCSRS